MTKALQYRELLTLAVVYQDEAGCENEALEIFALCSRIIRGQDGGEAIVQLCHEGVDAAKGEQDCFKRRPAVLSKQLIEQATAFRRLARATELAQAAHYRRSLRALLHSSPADLDDEDIAAAFRTLRTQRAHNQSLPPTSLPTATYSLW